ncbi:golgin subfamily A member 5-like [Xyrichtys novacula]|uniref:Golgin subfamily A member 5-like n=1 Tax=Xyrichtys novacula TaxID=13765 RepID=A0AAV1GRE9_XYRNO|nr:golgin subfamily A member 5-like [Xyrichtys novacula]
MQNYGEPQTFSQREQGGRQAIHQALPQVGLGVHQQAPYHQEEQASPPLWTPTSWDQIDKLNLRLTRERGVRKKQQELIEALKGEIRELQHKVKLERCEGCESVFLQQNMGYYSDKTKEELMGVISAQNDIIIEKNTPTTLTPVDISKMTRAELSRANTSLTRANTSLALQMQGVMTVLKAQEAANKALEQEMAELKKCYIGEMAAAPFSLEEKAYDAQEMAGVQELQDQVASLKKKLDDERQRASTLQQEQEEMRSMFEEKISKDREQVQRLNAEKLSLEEQVKKLQELQLDERMEKEKDILKTTVDDLLQETSKLEDQEGTSNVICEEDDPDTVKETAEMEGISLWRRFKKSVTPKHRRQYKRQRQMQRQD